MGFDVTKSVVLFGGLAALFAWSVRAGLVALALIALWASWLAGREALQRRAAKKRLAARMAAALAEQGLTLDAVFHSFHGVSAIGIASRGHKFIHASQEDCEIHDADAILEAKATRLAQGDFEIGISVPGRVTKKPYWRGLIVRRRRDATRWVQTARPYLGARLSVDGLD